MLGAVTEREHLRRMRASGARTCSIVGRDPCRLCDVLDAPLPVTFYEVPPDPRRYLVRTPILCIDDVGHIRSDRRLRGRGLTKIDQFVGRSVQQWRVVWTLQGRQDGLGWFRTPIHKRRHRGIWEHQRVEGSRSRAFAAARNVTTVRATACSSGVCGVKDFGNGVQLTTDIVHTIATHAAA